MINSYGTKIVNWDYLNCSGYKSLIKHMKARVLLFSKGYSADGKHSPMKSRSLFLTPKSFHHTFYHLFYALFILMNSENIPTRWILKCSLVENGFEAWLELNDEQTRLCEYSCIPSWNSIYQSSIQIRGKRGSSPVLPKYLLEKKRWKTRL